MLSQEQLQRLVGFLSDDPPVVSLYLDVDTTRRTKEEFRLVLRNLLKGVAATASPRDIEAIEHFFDFEYDGQARGVIVFSCQDKGLWEVYSLALPVQDRLVVARRPYVTPLQDILDEYASYGVIYVDKEGASFYLFSLGELQSIDGTLGDELKRHKQGGWAAQRLQRRADGIAHQNLKEAARAAQIFLQQHRCKRILLAGTNENIAIFRAMLPKAMQDDIVGEFALDPTAGENEVREKSMQVLKEHMQAEENTLVERMITEASKGEAGVIGLSDTLQALQEDRVQILIVSEGFEAQGYRCSHCGYLGADGEVNQCPYCGGDVRTHDHVVDAAVRTAIEKGVLAKIITGHPALNAAGHIGAILRY